MSTLAVCGVAALIVPPASLASDTSDASRIAAAPDRTQAERGLAAEPIVTDPVDSEEDDDGGDDASAASAAVPSRHGASHSFNRSWLLSHLVVVPRAEQVLEGHALRGPPSITRDEFDVDDDDDRFGSFVPPSTAASYPRPRPLFRSQLDHALCPATDGQSLRAP